MTHIHDQGSTVIKEDSSSALMILVAVIVGFALIWAVFFSGWVMDRGSDTSGNPDTTTNIDRRTEGDTNVDVNNPPAAPAPAAPSSPAP